MNPRRVARAVALQALYEIDCTSHEPAEVVGQRLADQPMEHELAMFTRHLVAGVLTHRAALDQLIQKYAPEWPLEQLAVIDRNVLRLCIWEWAVAHQTPIKVAINEAVELAKIYGSDNAPRFVNGVLGALAEQQDTITRQFEVSA